jgi:hypothetical protein
MAKPSHSVTEGLRYGLCSNGYIKTKAPAHPARAFYDQTGRPLNPIYKDAELDYFTAIIALGRTKA